MRIDAMPIIAVDNLSKIFRVNQKEPGLGGALKALVRPRHVDKTAVADFSLAEPDLSSVVKQIYGGALRQAAPI